MFTIDDLFDIAINMEKNGEAVYVDSVLRIDRPELKDKLQWMAREEARHHEWFTDQKNQLTLGIEEKHLKEMVPGALQQMMDEKALSLDDIDFSQMNNINDLFEAFIDFEEDTIRFYEVLEMFISDPAAKKGLDIIVEEEKKHVANLCEMISKL
jgi:rubrerythrin